MNKSEFVDEIAAQAELSKAEAARAVDAMITTVTEALGRGSEVALPGLGKFTVTERSAREGRNPATGETIQIPASKAPKFTAASALKAALKG